jgi:hypothetical protein
MGKNFRKIEDLLPEAQVKEKYHIGQPLPCVIFLQWFTQGKKRFADVYVSKECSPALVAKMKRMKTKFPLRHVEAPRETFQVEAVDP